MDNEFMKCIKFVLEKEGGYVNDPKDPGGETKYGISKRSFPNLDIANLTVDAACQLYYDRYWLPSGANSLSWPLNLCTLDSAVLDGLGTAALLQKRANGDVKNFIHERWLRYIRLVDKKPDLKRFLQGWLNRLNDLKKFIDVQNQLDALK